MNCVKCGREIEENQVFCQSCLEEMEQYPVKPGTAVHIPSRKTEEEFKKVHHKKRPILTPSEQIAKLRKKVLRLRILAVLLMLICGVLGYVVARTVEELDFQRLLGQNYNTIITSDATEHTEPLTETTAP